MTLPKALLLAAVPALLVAAPKPSDNPLLAPWKTPFGVPPFAAIKPEHFLPALQEGMRQQKAEVAAITRSKSAPTFRNTIEAFERTGETLVRVERVFTHLTGAESSEAYQALEEKVQPMLAAHRDDLALDEALFRRVKAVYEQRASLKLDAEQRTLLEKTYRRFARGGASLTSAQKERFRAINAELSSLQVKFGANLLKDTNAYKLVVEKQEDLAGLPADQVASAAEAAAKAGLKGWVFTLKAPSIWPFLQSAQSRELRRQILEAYIHRCEAGDTDNRPVFAKIAALRAEKAQLLGFKTWAHFMLDDNMAKVPEKAYALLEQLWKPGLALAKREAADIQAMIDQEKGGFKLEPWDWRFYAEKVKKAKYDLDEEALKPYFPLDQVREGAFALAGRLYGITFHARKDLPVWNPEVKAYEVKERDGSHLGVLYMDAHPRPGKRSGAWCDTLRDQQVKGGRKVSPVVYNVCNFSRPAGDAPALLTPDEVETLFHEFGHGLHALFSNVQYRSLSGLNTAIDFCELPSQVMENWVFEPAMLRMYAKHWKTGEPIPASLVLKLRKAGNFNQGFLWTERLAASLLDMDWHSLAEPKVQDATAFEKASLDRWGLIPEIVVRYRTPYFNHAATDYSAGYYSYTWSEVLDSDAFHAFVEKGNLFDPATARSFRENVLSKGGSEDPMLLYTRFRGREPKVEALLEKRGLK